MWSRFGHKSAVNFRIDRYSSQVLPAQRRLAIFQLLKETIIEPRENFAVGENPMSAFAWNACVELNREPKEDQRCSQKSTSGPADLLVWISKESLHSNSLTLMKLKLCGVIFTGFWKNFPAKYKIHNLRKKICCETRNV